MSALSHRAGFWYCRMFTSRRTFAFQGRRYRYFCHRYNNTWLNERAVEIPIAVAAREPYRPEDVLEIGNVLAHYVPVRHDVVDKYERSPGVVNEDIASFRPPKRYRLILSVSTLEHVGWDEEPRDPRKIFAAIANARQLLLPGGSMVITVPLGYHPELDRALAAGAMRFRRIGYLKRISADNRWREATVGEVGGMAYGKPFPFANAVAVGVLGPLEA